MDGEGMAPEVAEAFEDGRAIGRAEVACDCSHRAGCPNRPEPTSWWRRWLDTVTS